MGNGSSQDNLSNHILCSNIFMVITNGDKSPNGSKILAITESNSRLVLLLQDIAVLMENKSSSEVVYQPRQSNLSGSLEPIFKLSDDLATLHNNRSSFDFHLRRGMQADASISVTSWRMN